MICHNSRRVRTEDDLPYPHNLDGRAQCDALNTHLAGHTTHELPQGLG